MLLKIPNQTNRKSYKKVCPCCRCDINKVFTTSQFKDDKMDILIDLCNGYTSASKQVRVLANFDDVCGYLKTVLKRAKVNAVSVEYVPIDSYVQHDFCDAIIWFHPPIFSSASLNGYNLWKLSNMCHKMQILVIDSSPDADYAKPLLGRF